MISNQCAWLLTGFTSLTILRQHGWGFHRLPRFYGGFSKLLGASSARCSTMVPAHYANLLHAEGFQKIGELSHRLHLTAWWNPAPEKLLQVIVLNVGSTVLIKADKS